MPAAHPQRRLPGADRGFNGRLSTTHSVAATKQLGKGVVNTSITRPGRTLLISCRSPRIQPGAGVSEKRSREGVWLRVQYIGRIVFALDLARRPSGLIPGKEADGRRPLLTTTGSRYFHSSPAALPGSRRVPSPPSPWRRWTASERPEALAIGGEPSWSGASGCAVVYQPASRRALG